eukprot:gene17077-biopygen5530
MAPGIALWEGGGKAVCDRAVLPRASAIEVLAPLGKLEDGILLPTTNNNDSNSNIDEDSNNDNNNDNNGKNNRNDNDDDDNDNDNDHDINDNDNKNNNNNDNANDNETIRIAPSSVVARRYGTVEACSANVA